MGGKYASGPAGGTPGAGPEEEGDRTVWALSARCRT